MSKVDDFLARFFLPDQTLFLASSEKGRYRADVFLIAEATSVSSSTSSSRANFDLRFRERFAAHETVLPHTVFSRADEQGLFIPQLVTELPHIPYSETQRGLAQMDDSIGLFIQIEDIFDRNAEAARFTQETLEREVAVTEQRAVLFNWNSKWLPLRQQLHISALRFGDRWENTVAPTIACRASTFANAWADYQRGDNSCHWAPEALNAVSFDETLTLVRSLLLNLDAKDSVFRIFAEGPLQDLLCDELLAFIESDGAFHERWAEALSFIATSPLTTALPKALVSRISAFCSFDDSAPTLES